VYNLPKSTAIDIIQGNSCKTLLSAAIVQDTLLQNFYLQPTRLRYRAAPKQGHILSANNYLLHIANKSILIIDKSLPAISPLHKLQVDAVIITGNPKVYASQINALINSPVVVFDGSNPLWKIERWKKDCNSLHLRFHSVAQEGAFVMDL
jgi:competence protein ComEC